MTAYHGIGRAAVCAGLGREGHGGAAAPAVFAPAVALPAQAAQRRFLKASFAPSFRLNAGVAT